MSWMGKRQSQLFNLNVNPHELLPEHRSADVIRLTGNSPGQDQINLAGMNESRQKQEELERLLLALQVQYGDPYRLWDQPAIEAK